MLSSDITQQIELEHALRRLNDELEQRVEQRTQELTIANAQLANEITERQQTQHQLMQIQKLDAIGRLAGGIAHDFNNLLTVIIGNSELLLAEIPNNNSLRIEVESIHHAAQKGAELTRQLLAFSRQQVLSPQVLDLNVVVQKSGSLLQRLIGKHIQLRLDVYHTPCIICVDRTQMEQVIMNLVVNARDAMPEGGSLWLRTTMIERSAADKDIQAIINNGSIVQLHVEDSGIGMAPETIERIFEPFFTTKPVNQGTGLGLATVHGIVSQSGGHIRINSTLGQGTTFIISLPEYQALD